MLDFHGHCDLGNFAKREREREAERARHPCLVAKPEESGSGRPEVENYLKVEASCVTTARTIRAIGIKGGITVSSRAISIIKVYIQNISRGKTSP